MMFLMLKKKKKNLKKKQNWACMRKIEGRPFASWRGTCKLFAEGHSRTCFPRTIMLRWQRQDKSFCT